MVLIDEAVYLVGNVHVLDGGGDFIFLFVAHLAHDVPEILSRTGLGQSGDDVTGLEASHWPDMFPDQSYALLCHCFGAVSGKVLCLDGHECNWDFSFDLVMRTNNNGLCDFTVFHQDFLHLASGKTVSCSVNDIVFSGHYVEVAVFIVVP